MFKFTGERGLLRCSFCGKEQGQVGKLIAGPGVYICDQCVALCVTIIQAESPAPGTFRFAARRPDGTVQRVEVPGVQWQDGHFSALHQCRACGGWMAGVGWTECPHCAAGVGPRPTTDG